MKRFLPLGLCMVLTLSGMCQDKFDYYLWPYNEKTNKVEFAESVRAQGIIGDSLFSYAKQFLSATFNTTTDTLISEDTSTNVIVSKSSIHLPVKELGSKGIGYISFKFLIRCRNNNFSYSLTNFEHRSSSPNGIAGGPLELEMPIAGGRIFPRRYWNDYKARCYFAIQNTLEQLKDAMMRKAQG